MKKLPASKVRKAEQINRYLEANAPSFDLRDRSKVGPVLNMQLIFWWDHDHENQEEWNGEYRSEECEAQEETDYDANVKIVEFAESYDGSGTWQSVLIPKDLLGLSCVSYRSNRIEVRRYWTQMGPQEITAVFDWDDPQLFAKVLVAATEDICADWDTLYYQNI